MGLCGRCLLELDTVSHVGNFDLAVAPLTFSLVQHSPPPSLPSLCQKYSTVYRDSMWLGGGRGC